MFLKNKLLKLDYLVYSSHKTGTQTLVNTLLNSGFKSRHCHELSNIGLQNEGFKSYVEKYHTKNKKKLNVISVFREPMERHISSFFQCYGTRPLNLKTVKSEHETIIRTSSVKQLQEKYIDELSKRSLMGFRESLHDICAQLDISSDQLIYNNEKRFSLYETEHIKLYLFRFDILFNNLDTLLTEITDKKTVITTDNMSNAKWYQDIYTEFKATLKIPNQEITNTYNLKKDLINLFYFNDYDSTLKKALNKYGEN